MYLFFLAFLFNTVPYICHTLQLSKSAQEAASKVKEQGEELSKSGPFKTVSTVSWKNQLQKNEL
jgi:hypothetical protein